MTDSRTVTIPARDDHDGWHAVTVTLNWACPTCGGPRGEVEPTISWDGSRRLYCDGWKNSCGHVDFYSDVRHEAGVVFNVYSDNDPFDDDVAGPAPRSA